jgi:hypothetical protein
VCVRVLLFSRWLISFRSNNCHFYWSVK